MYNQSIISVTENDNNKTYLYKTISIYSIIKKENGVGASVNMGC